MSAIDELLRRARPVKPGLPLRPARELAVLACMDSRLDLFAILGLEPGEAHIVRNAGGVVTPDAIRSLTISQRLLGTRGIVLVHHTDCGMQTITDDGFKADLAEATGMRPDWAVEAFADVDEDLRQSVARISHNPFLAHKDDVRGFVYEVETGRLREVHAEDRTPRR